MESGPCSEVCALDDGCGDHPAFYTEAKVTARKPHKCCECREEIAKGSQYWSCRGKWDGGVQTFKQCLLCREIATKYGCDGFSFTAVWEQLRDNLFPTMTTGCLDGLSVAAKHKMVDAWRKWKGLANA